MTGAFLTLLLAAIVALALIAKRLHVPYPIVFVFGGIAVALIPGIPAITLKPDLVFLLFLPPLIFGDAWTTDVRAFARYAQPILMLAIGLVAFTSVAVAFTAQWMMGIPLALGFVLGGVLSPTDAVATDAIAEEVGLPRRLAAIVNGESLVNDASGLVIYKFAIVAVMTGAFSFAGALAQFVYVVVVGLGTGIVIAWALAHGMMWLRKNGLSDELIAVSISLMSPFAAYVPADALGASGVLAAMSGGMYLSSKSSQIFDADSRIAAASIWNFLFFAFNGAAFVLIGLQLPSILAALRAERYAPATLIGWALAIALVVIAVRFVWVFPVSRLRRILMPKYTAREGPRPPATWTLVLATSGMRGIVSLAAALALPERLPSGAPFPGRDLILFITFVVILVTLVGEGLALPVLIRKLHVVDVDDGSTLLAFARLRTAEAARDHLRTLETHFASTTEWEVAGRIQAHYEERVMHFSTHAPGTATEPDDSRALEIERRLRGEAYGAERRALMELRRSGAITDEVYRELEWDIDLAESRVD